MRTEWGIWGLLALAGCASATPSTPPPSACRKTDRAGTYRQTFTTESGACGDLPEQLVSFTDPMASAAPGIACRITSETWSDNDCKLERTISCRGPDGLTTGTGVTRQETANASVVDGTFSVSVRLNDGWTCQGTYGVHSVRE
jgi:hypothetical protein